MKLIRALLAILLLGVAAGATSASAHLKTGTNFYFHGSTYSAPDLRERKDPLNLLFMGGTNQFGSNRVHAGNVGLVLSDWDPQFEARMTKPFDTPPALGCQDAQFLRWRYMPGGETVHEDFQRLATHAGCRRQYHIRGWEDGPHWKNVPSHGRRDQFVLAGVHHEHLYVKKSGCGLGLPRCLGHKIDRDWDAVRSQSVSALKKYCSSRRWIYHPGADMAYQGFDNSGFLARISLHRVSDGGCSGQ